MSKTHVRSYTKRVNVMVQDEQWTRRRERYPNPTPFKRKIIEETKNFTGDPYRISFYPPLNPDDLFHEYSQDRRKLIDAIEKYLRLNGFLSPQWQFRIFEFPHYASSDDLWGAVLKGESSRHVVTPAEADSVMGRGMITRDTRRSIWPVSYRAWIKDGKIEEVDYVIESDFGD